MRPAFRELLLVSLTFNCFCAGTDVVQMIFGPRLKAGPRPRTGNEQEDPIHDYVKEILSEHEYPLEKHRVISSQGYILTLYRLPLGKKSNNSEEIRKPIALLNVGLFGSPESFLFRGPEHDLPYTLADSGYDTWIICHRGSYYSKKHLLWHPEYDKEYWNFSFHELGIYDLPSIIDYILNLTKQEDLFYIGYSMGATIGYILCSTKPEYNHKIRHFISFAPYANVVHEQTTLQRLILLAYQDMAHSLRHDNITGLFPRRSTTMKILTHLCKNGSNLQDLCISVLFAITGVDYNQFNPDLIPSMFGCYPDGASLMMIEHVLQLFAHGVFRQYDYGVKGNKIMYKSDLPPRYNLSRITTPISLYYGDGDVIVTKEDCESLASMLPNMMGIHKIPHRSFNHMDFMWAKDVRKLLYIPVVNLLNKYI